MSFATPEDLATRLGVAFDPGELLKVQAHLDDATAWLQAELGQLIEAGTATYTTRLREGPLRLPQFPVRSVTEVLVNGVAVTNYDFIDQELHLADRWGVSDFGERTTFTDVTVTFDYGFTVIPAELIGWCCVLASQSLDAAAGGYLGSPRVRSEQIDDYSVTYVTNGSSMTLPPDVLSRLRSRYGAGAYVTGVGR